jgi:hypothetical protein
MTKDEALTLEALKYAASMGYGRIVREMKIAPFTIKCDAPAAQPPLPVQPAQGATLQEQLQKANTDLKKARDDVDKARADRHKARADVDKALADWDKAYAEVARTKKLIEEQNT